MIGSRRRFGWACLAALLLFPALPAPAQTPPPPQATVAKPVVKPIAEYDDFIGRFQAVNAVDIRARVSGYVATIQFTDGAVVKAGDPLFVIDQAPYKAALEEAQASLGAAQAALDYATVDLNRAAALRQTGDVTQQIFDTRRQSLETATANVNGAKAALTNAELNLQFTEIKAPVAGKMSRRRVSLGDLVNANDTVLTNIVSVDPIHFYFDVDERTYLAYQKLTSGGLTVSSDSDPNDVLVATSNEQEPTHRGRMDFTENQLDSASGTMRARAVLDNKDGMLLPGLFGRLRLLGSVTYDGVLVPAEAVGTDQNRRVVYVVGADNAISLAPVRLGPIIDGYRVIREGLKGEETIVVNGLSRVRPGIKIDPKMSTLPPTRRVDVNP